MKKLFFAIAISCVLLLTACGSHPRPIPVDVPPPVEQKNETLKVYCTDLGGSMERVLETAISFYKRDFPGRNVEIEKTFPETFADFDDMYLKMITQVMAGDGPDIFAIDTRSRVIDVEKLARNGAFADMEPYFQADNYDWSDFNQAVMDGGVWEGKRLVIPMTYRLPILYTSAGALAETGFSIENCKDFQGLMAEVEKMQQDSSQPRSPFRLWTCFSQFPYHAGIKYISYDQATVELSLPELRRGLDIYRELIKTTLKDGDQDDILGAAAIRDGEALWAMPGFMHQGLIYCGGLIRTFDDFVMMPVRDVNGGIQARIFQAIAVRNNSENLENVYDFLKILLSKELGQTETVLGMRWDSFTVQNSLNFAYYEKTVTNRQNEYLKETAGFTEVNPPTPEEFEQLMSYTQEVSGAYFMNELRTDFVEQMKGYVTGEISYDQALKQAQKQLEIYLSE